MSKRQYEDFLVTRFCHWAEQNLRIGERIHFRSPDDANSLLLHQAFVRQANTAELPVVVDKSIQHLPYLAIGNYRVVPVLHAERGIGFTENYISTLRDIVSSPLGQLKNCVLLVIHNSSLDTLNNSSRNLCLAEHDVWNPAVIRDALKAMIDPHATSRKISEALLDHQFNSILAEGATMFGFRDLYNAVQDGHIEFKELNLLDDPAIGSWDNTAAIEKRLTDNKKLKDQIEHLVEQFPSELSDKLKEFDFSEKFIKQHFPDGDLTSWRNTLDYGECQKEQENNRENLLELENESVDFGHKFYPGSKGESGSGARERYFIIEVPSTEPKFKLNLSFVNGQIKDDQVRLRSQDKNFSVSVKRSSKRNIIEVSGSFSGNPTYLSLDLKRSKPQENFRYRVLLLPVDAFYVEAFATNFMLQPSKSKIVLQTDSTSIQLALSGTNVTMSENGQEFDVTATGSIDFEQLVNTTDRLNFKIRNAQHVLQFDVEGAVSSGTLSLPLLLDKELHTRLFNDDFYGVFNSISCKVALDGKEIKPRTEQRKFLLSEANLLQQQLLSDAVSGRAAIYLNDLAKPYPDLFDDYTELFTYLNAKRSLLSLSAWGEEITSVVKRLVNHYITALQQIQTTRLLNAEEQLLVNLGFACVEQQEYLTPYHPLNLAYFVSLTDALQADDTKSFKTLPPPTLRRLNAEGLIPFNWHNHHDFSFSQVVKENPMWLQVVPSRQSQLDYIQRLVKDKTKEFVEAFSTLFASGEKDTLLINSINNGHNKEVLLGLAEFFKKRKPEQTSRIHINLYDEQLQHTYFDKVADAETLDEVKRLCELTADTDDADSTIDMLRRRITYSKFRLPQAGESFNYAHLSFVRNNTPVMTSPVDITAEQSGIACHGVLAGETSYSEQNDYFTTAGLKNIDVSDSPQLQVMQKYSALCKAAWLGEKYSETSSLALKVSSQLQQLLEAVYEDSIWTTIIDPKVTLNFFKSQKDVVLIHYSDNYTNSANYDAITVTKRRDFYDQILAQGNQGLIDEFNAFNGEWLLKMLTLPDNERREKKSIIAAYKYINCLLFHSDITWVPLSVAEMLRVAGNIGLKMSDADFSRYSQGIRQGAISDDVLFVGFKEQQMYLLPLEVKVGKKQKHDKGVRQAKELKRYLVEQLFGRPDLAGHLYRGLFIRQIFMQIDKYELYRVYVEQYFSQLKDEREWWLQGDYSLADIDGYPQGFVLAFIEGDYSNEQYGLDQNILQIKLPSGYQAKFVSTPLQKLLTDCSSKSLGFIDAEYILQGETKAVEIEWSAATVEIEDDIVVHDDAPSAEDDANAIIAFDTEFPEAGQNSSVIQTNHSPTPAVNQLENCRILIGHSPKTQEAIYWEYGHKDLANRHLIIFGNSGQGKTYCIQGLLMELAKHSVNSMVVDYTNGFLPEHLEHEFISSVKPKTDLVADKPLKLNPFKKQKNIVAGTELTDKAYDVATRVASVFKSVYSSIGDQQLPTLIRVIEEGLATYGAQYSFDHMVQALEEYDQTGVKLANKLLPLVRANVFAFDNTGGWNEIYQSKDSVCRLIQMARLSRDVWLAAVEFILWDLYSFACLHGDKNSPLPIVLDEVQNLDHRLESPLGKMLTEGRKYGISLILATQTMSNLGKDEQDRLFQASHKLFFAPAMTEVQTYAKLLEQAVPGSDKKYWLSELSKLKKGECISVGMHANANGVLVQSAKTLSVQNLRTR